jgi:hypothetical protein
MTDRIVRRSSHVTALRISQARVLPRVGDPRTDRLGEGSACGTGNGQDDLRVPTCPRDKKARPRLAYLG